MRMMIKRTRSQDTPWCCQGLQARSSDRDLSQADFIKASGHGYRTKRPET